MALAWHCYCRKQFNTLKDSTVLFINILCSLLTPYWLHPFLIISSCLVKSICNKLIMQSNVLMLMQSSSLVWDYLFAIQKYLLNTHHHSMQDSLINVILLRVLTVHCVYEMMLQKNITHNLILTWALQCLTQCSRLALVVIQRRGTKRRYRPKKRQKLFGSHFSRACSIPVVVLIPNPLLSRPHRAPAQSPPLIQARRRRAVRREPWR
jgi:hypothetical protein